MGWMDVGTARTFREWMAGGQGVDTTSSRRIHCVQFAQLDLGRAPSEMLIAQGACLSRYSVCRAAKVPGMLR